MTGATPRRPSTPRVLVFCSLLVTVLLSASACGASPAPRTAAPMQAPPGSTTVSIHTRDGASFVLTDPQGFTLYYFAGDESDGTSIRCVGDCAANWVPFTASSVAVTKPDVLPAPVDTVKRADGVLQVRYDGRPLYRFAQDHGRGDRNGQDIESWTVAYVELACDCGRH